MKRIKINTTITKAAPKARVSKRSKNFNGPAKQINLKWYEEQALYDRLFTADEEYHEYYLDRQPDSQRFERALDKAREEHRRHRHQCCANKPSECLNCEVENGS